MAEVSGLEMARRIRQSKLNAMVPIVMVTAKRGWGSTQHAFKAGVNFVLTKPLTVEKVQRLLNASRGVILTERHRSRRVAAPLDCLCAWNGEKVQGKTVNLSASGVFFRPERTPPVGADLRLPLELPGLEEKMELGGTVVHVCEGMGVGIKFRGAWARDRKRLADFVAQAAEAQSAERVI